MLKTCACVTFTLRYVALMLDFSQTITFLCCRLTKQMASNKNERTTPAILDGVVYNIVSNANGKIITECVNCINQKKISGTLISMSSTCKGK